MREKEREEGEGRGRDESVVSLARESSGTGDEAGGPLIFSHLCVNHACNTSIRLISTRFVPLYSAPPGARDTCATKRKR